MPQVTQDQQVLIAYADPLARAYLRSLVERHLPFESTAEVDSFVSLVEFLKANQNTRLAVVDIDLPGLSADVGLRYLGAHYQARFAVMFSSLTSEMIAQLIGGGVAACVPKDVGEDMLVSAFNMVLNGSIYIPFALGGPQEHPLPAAREAQPDFLDQELTERQAQVLRLVAMGHSNKQIAQMLNIAEGTVKVHVNAMFRALGVHNRVNAAAALKRYFEHPPKDLTHSEG